MLTHTLTKTIEFITQLNPSKHSLFLNFLKAFKIKYTSNYKSLRQQIKNSTTNRSIFKWQKLHKIDSCRGY